LDHACVGLALIVLLIAVPAEAEAQPGTELRCPIPADWIDLSPGAPPQRLDAVPPGTRAAARSQDWKEYAAAPDFRATMGLLLETEGATEPIDARYLDDLTSSVLKSGELASVDRRETLVISGLTWGRIEGTTPDGFRVLAYVVPGNPRNGYLMFASPADQYRKLEPKFDALARETQGFASPPPRRGPMLSVLFGSVAALLVGLRGLAMVRRRKQRPRT
jgi:hypothetical protein